MLEYLKRTRKVQAFHRLHFSQNGDYIMEMKPQPKRNGFATFSLVLAIAALASTLTMTIVIPIFLAILSIMFGLLSRGNTSMSNHALAGVIVACSALLINIAVGGFSFFIVFSNSDAKQQYWTMVNDTYEQMTGLTFDEILNEYGGSCDNILQNSERKKGAGERHIMSKQGCARFSLQDRPL